MIHLLGSICILWGGCLGIWFQTRERRRRRETLHEITKALRWMTEEIRMTRMALPRIFELLSHICVGEAGTFFRRTSEAVAKGEPPKEVWRQEVEKLPLSAGDKAVLLELNFQGDEEQLRKDIFLAVEGLAVNEAERRKNEPQEVKRAAALWASAALLLVILLI